MRHLIWLLAVLVLTIALSGCGGEKDHGLYRNQDKPQEAPGNNK